MSHDLNRNSEKKHFCHAPSHQYNIINPKVEYDSRLCSYREDCSEQNKDNYVKINSQALDCLKLNASRLPYKLKNRIRRVNISGQDQNWLSPTIFSRSQDYEVRIEYKKENAAQVRNLSTYRFDEKSSDRINYLTKPMYVYDCIINKMKLINSYDISAEKWSKYEEK